MRIFSTTRRRIFATIKITTPEISNPRNCAATGATTCASVVPGARLLTSEIFLAMTSLRKPGKETLSSAAVMPPAEMSASNPLIFRNVPSNLPAKNPSEPNSEGSHPATVDASVIAKINATKVEMSPKKHLTKPFFAPPAANISNINAQTISAT